jgi:PilZ domain
MTDSSTKKLFQKIISPRDKLRILDQVAANQIELRARVNNSTEFKTKPKSWLRPLRMEVEAPRLKLGLESLTIQFESEDERYFSTVELAFDDWKIYFVFSGPLYRLQRRQYQRLQIPSRYENRVLIMNVDDVLWNDECQALDLSLGGCSLNVSYRSIDILVGSVVMMDIKIGNSPSFVVIGVVCYKRPVKINGKSKLKIGVQFRPHPKYTLQLQTVVQTLAVDIFSNWEKGKS